MMIFTTNVSQLFFDDDGPPGLFMWYVRDAHPAGETWASGFGDTFEQAWEMAINAVHYFRQPSYQERLDMGDCEAA